MTATPPVPGFVQWFRLGEYDTVEACIASLQVLGVQRLRTHLSWADYHAPGGRAWYRWLLSTLGSRFELLPSVHYTPPFLSENGRTSGPPRDLRALADFIDTIITDHGSTFDTVEVWNEPNNLLDWDWRLDPDWLKFCTMAGAAAYWIRQRGKRVVLGGPCPTDINWLRLMGERGVLGVVDAVGVHGFPGTWDSIDGGTWPGWAALLHQVRETVLPFNPALELWITEAGYATWRHDPFNQVRAFLDAAEAPADRLYWYSLRDIPAGVAVQEGLNFDPRHYHFGVQQADGRPKLLGRMLQQGMQAVQNLAGARRSVSLVGSRKPVLITGGAGFIGSNLADRLASEGEHVLLFDSLERPGVEANLAWLRERYPTQVSAIIADVRDAASVQEAVTSASAVFHLAAQVAVTTSLLDPMEDLQVNLVGTFNVLQALRHRRQPCVFASTNKVYGKLAGVELSLVDEAWQPADARLRASGVDERQALDFCTPYGCSKGAADQYMLDYAASFGIPSAVMRMSCIYGPRQLGTEDQGWVAHFLLRALAGETISIFGDGCQMRDVLYVDDAVDAYIAAWRGIDRIAGTAFNLGGGPDNAISLRQLVRSIGALLGKAPAVRYDAWRPNDQRWYVSDTSRIRAALDLPVPRNWQDGLALLLRSFQQTDQPARAPERRRAAVQA
jgi:CDP-paratose 2-epimerase